MKWLRLLCFLPVIVFFLTSACQANKDAADGVREPAFAGKFYPASADKLRLTIEKYLQDALPPRVKKPVAVIVPHAGYIFSGQICADGFRQAGHHPYDVVVILGTNHTSPGLQGVSLYPGEGFRTPLGIAAVDKTVIESLLTESPVDCMLDKSAHVSEHSVEVIVPFVQIVFPNAKIVPAVVGTQDRHTSIRFGQALAKVLKNKNALIVASSDLSHYPSRDNAVKVDRQTLDAVATLDPAVFQKTIQDTMSKNIPNLSTCACGEAPIIAALAAARLLGADRGNVISYANSGDVSVGDSAQVVGYGAVVLMAGQKGISSSQTDRQKTAAVPFDLGTADKKALLAFARETLSRFFTTDTVPLARHFPAHLNHPRGVFVTLKKNGALRGCIGHLITDEPLVKLVGAMALQAALNDGRFPPLTAEELPDVDIEISVLTPMKQAARPSDIMVGRDGVVLSKDGRSAVFLPQVALEQSWSRDDMLDHLCSKAGLEKRCWRQDATFSIFQAIVFTESQLK